MRGPGISAAPPLEYMPGEVIVRVEPAVLHESLGAARVQFTGAMAAMLPGSIAEPMAFLERNVGLHQTVPVFSTRHGALARAPLSMSQKNRLAVISSVKHAAEDDLSGVAILKVNAREPIEPVVNLLRKDQAFAYVEPVPARYIGGAPSGDTGSPADRQWALRAIRWALAKRLDGSQMRVAVLDTGIDRTHPDLKGVVGSYRYASLKVEDIVGHGTHVAGILAAIAAAADGVTGVSNCKLDVWKIFSDVPKADGRHYVDHTIYLRALRAALKSGARVVNLSISGTKWYQTEDLLMRQFVAKDVLVVGAMGNAAEVGNPVSYPAALGGVLAVGAIDRELRRAVFSNTGKHVFAAAPGVEVRSSIPLKKSASREETRYAEWDGPSMAAPHVAAAAALFFIAFPVATTAAFKARLASTAQKPTAMKKAPWTDELGHGVLNLEGLLKVE